MTVFYYICPECGSRLVEPNKTHTLMTCLKCNFEWRDEDFEQTDEDKLLVERNPEGDH